MRLTWSAKRVFVVVAVGWFLTAVGLVVASRFVPIASQSWLGAAVELALAGPRHIAFSIALETVLMFKPEWSSGAWRGPRYYSQLGLTLAASSLFWATVVTTAYVIVLRLRERRSASKEA